jgi:hypothetical protein
MHGAHKKALPGTAILLLSVQHGLVVDEFVSILKKSTLFLNQTNKKVDIGEALIRVKLVKFSNSLIWSHLSQKKREKNEKPKWFSRQVKKENLISNEDVTEFVNAMKDVVFTAIFSKSNQSDAKRAFQYLSFLRGEIMLPQLIDKIYESLESLTEPHRYTSMLTCLVSVGREIARYNPFHKVQTQMHVIQLLLAVLPGLDPNDSNKCFMTLQFIYNVTSCIVLCNCQPALNYRSDLSEHERELCFETNKFEDFIHEFFKRIFYIVDILASDISADSSASAAAASNQFSISSKGKHLDENVYQAQLIQTLRVIVRQSSKDIIKVNPNGRSRFAPKLSITKAYSYSCLDYRQ